MNERLQRLELRFNNHKDEMSRYDLIELIELLLYRKKELLETIEEISENKQDHNNDCDCDDCCQDHEFRTLMNKEDLD